MHLQSHAKEKQAMPGSSGLSYPLRELPAFELIESELERVRLLINQQLTTTSKAGGINQLLTNFNACAGKMIRPGLVLLSGGAVGNVTDRHVRVAAIVELIHNATLLHDDVIDEGQKRRGLPTINKLWGNESAVLLGDFLLSRVFTMCTDLGPEIISIIASTAVRTCEGELLQIAQRRNWQLSESEYIDIITEKSAVFFGSCCRLGALLAGGSAVQVESLARFGLNAGLAFQITDDLLDITGDENKAGKTLGSDVNKNKLTLAAIYMLAHLDEKKRAGLYRELNTVIKGHPRHASRQNAFVDKLRSSGSLKYAHICAKKYVAEAVQSLTALWQSDAKTALIETAEFIADRTV